MIIPFKAGGSADVEGRVIAEAAEKILSQPVVPVKNPALVGGIGVSGGDWQQDEKIARAVLDAVGDKY